MLSNLTRSDRDAVYLHLFFAIAATLMLTLPLGISVGWRLCVLVLLYNVLVPLTAWLRQHPDWLTLWLFLLPLSLWQIFPDWFLSAVLGVLVFPDTGAPKIGNIPIFMAGLWTIPLFIIIFLGRRIKTHTLWVVAAASVAMFDDDDPHL